MFKFINSRLSVKICVQVFIIVVPLLGAAVWQAADGERGATCEMLLDQGRVAAIAGAQAYANILENGVKSGALTLDEVLEPKLEEIHYGYEVEGKRYSAKYGDYARSHGAAELQDIIMASSSDFLYTSAIQAGGYVPVPLKQHDHSPIGDPNYDRKFARARLKYEKGEPVAASTYDGQAPTQVIDYHRDTGDEIWDVVAPIHVMGKHFGAFRVGVRKDRVGARAWRTAVSLSVLLGAAVFAMSSLILFVVHRTTRSLVDLARSATRLSTDYDGTDLRLPIRVTGRELGDFGADEVGEMAAALERMRKSMVMVHRISDQPRSGTSVERAL